MSKTRVMFTVKLARKLTEEEKQVLAGILEAQCENFIVDERLIYEGGYILGSAHTTYVEEEDIV